MYCSFILTFCKVYFVISAYLASVNSCLVIKSRMKLFEVLKIIYLFLLFNIYLTFSVFYKNVLIFETCFKLFVIIELLYILLYED